VRLLGLVVAALALVAGCGYGEVPAAEAPAVNGDPVAPAVVEQAVAAPVSVSIPAISITDEVVPVGLESSGELEVPDVTEVGWYTGLPKPGENGPGPALLAGHVDFKGVKGSFARIGELEVGDTVTVRDADGVEHRFEVYDVVEFPKVQYADRILGLLADTAEPEVRLVTCSGTVVNHNYLNNTIVSARLVA
jgi:sortase (surface protein transpeptidase)